MNNAQNARDFALQIDRAKLETDEAVNDVIQVIATSALSGVVRKSPVDTGRFRHNWITSKNTPSTQIKQGTANDAIASGSTQIQAFDYKRDGAIIIQNNLPYANRLENGWSKQAPSGMVGLTVNEISHQYSNVLVRLKSS